LGSGFSKANRIFKARDHLRTVDSQQLKKCHVCYGICTEMAKWQFCAKMHWKRPTN
jgi:hypothetical protein